MILPELAYVADVLARFMHTPRKDYWEATLKEARYLKCQPSESIYLQFDSSFLLTIYYDMDYANCPITRRSVTGYFASEDLLFLGRRIYIPFLVHLQMPNIILWP